MLQAAGEEPGGRSHGCCSEPDGARIAEGADPAALLRFLGDAGADRVVKGVRRGRVRPQHRRLVTLVPAGGLGAGGATVEMGAHFGALVAGELAVHVRVEEGFLELSAFERHGYTRLLNSRTSASASVSASSSIACFGSTTPDSTA